MVRVDLKEDVVYNVFFDLRFEDPLSPQIRGKNKEGRIVYGPRH